MKNTYIIPKARRVSTGETVTHMELSGQRFSHHQRDLAQQLAQRLAEQMIKRTNEQWTAFVDTVVEDQRR